MPGRAPNYQSQWDKPTNLVVRWIKSEWCRCGIPRTQTWRSASSHLTSGKSDQSMELLRTEEDFQG